MKEEHLLISPLEPTNRPYAIAKTAGIEMCWASPCVRIVVASLR